MQLPMIVRTSTIFVACFGIFSTSLVAKEHLQKNAQNSTVDKVEFSRQLSKSFVQIAKKATPSVVSIKSQISSKKMNGFGEQFGEQSDPQMDPFQDEFWQRFFGAPAPRGESKQKPMALGSGFVISSDGYIITNNHLVADAEKISVTFSDGKDFAAKLIGKDPSTDIALLKIEANNLACLQFGNSDTLEPGEFVMAIGNPLGLRSSISTGVVSGLGRNDLSITAREEFIQTDAAINRGNSGGPLLNLDGEVVGMATAMASATGGSMGIGFAVPSNMIKNITEQLRANGKVVRGYLGIAPQNVDSDIASTFNLEKAEGALVAEVVKNSPADKAGIQPGDVVTKINNKNVENAGSLRNVVSLMKPDEKVTLTIQRGDKELTLQAIVALHPESEMAVSDVQEQLGILVQEVTPEIAEQLNLGDEKGVMIKYVSPNSMAAEIGLRRGQLILSVNRSPVTTPAEFYSKVQEFSSRKQILLHVKAGQSYRFITLKFE